jgi:hypothetical protein
MAYLIRKGDPTAEAEFASTMQWTLDEPAFQSFQSLHGPFPIRYADWFYAKLEQFLDILLYEKLLVWGMDEYGAQGVPQTDRPWEEGNGILTGTTVVVDPRQLPAAFLPQQCRAIDWFRIVHRLAAIKTAKAEAVRKYLRRRAELIRRSKRRNTRTRAGSHSPQPIVLPRDAGAGKGTPKRRRSRSVQTRDSIILSGLEEGVDRLEICQRLDDKGISTTSKMHKAGCKRWTEAWTNLDLRNNVQQVFSKTRARAKAVKT